MQELKETIEGLQELRDRDWGGEKIRPIRDLFNKAIGFLQDEFPRILSWEDLMRIYDLTESHSWPYGTPPYLCYQQHGPGGKDSVSWVSWYQIRDDIMHKDRSRIDETYGKTWIFWTRYPTKEQTENVTWEE